MVVPSPSCWPRLVAVMSHCWCEPPASRAFSHPVVASLLALSLGTLQPGLSFFSVRGCAGGLTVDGCSPVMEVGLSRGLEM